MNARSWKLTLTLALPPTLPAVLPAAPLFMPTGSLRTPDQCGKIRRVLDTQGARLAVVVLFLAVALVGGFVLPAVFLGWVFLSAVVVFAGAGITVLNALDQRRHDGQSVDE